MLLPGMVATALAAEDDGRCTLWIDYQELVKATSWSERWHNYQQYRTILETARELQTPVVALNARAETSRQIARSGGVGRLDAQARKELPEDLQLEDPVYEKLLNLELMAHMSATPETLRPIREAQICRDEMMAVMEEMTHNLKGRWISFG